ncbi:hypothetical protein L596_020173 [Steinernema carpocapsae]|uniref:glucuronosyltransferase n=1 Tax=Steinernema carpocapsae TaxID=34508 RepID=A0A4U5MSR0_STECR|nr:hypothetical protein L596_020173 [Steinernema carpocapsae]
MAVAASRLPFLVFLSFFASSYAAKIVLFTPDLANSHLIYHKRVSETLAKAGHNVTILLIHGFQKNKLKIQIDPRVTIWNVDAGVNRSEKFEKLHSQMTYSDSGLLSPETLALMNIMMATVRQSCENLVSDKAFMDRVKSEEFDLAFVSMFETCPIGIVHHAKIPSWIWLNAGQLMDHIASEMGAPQPSSYVPIMMFDMKDSMTFFERTKNFVMANILSVTYRYLSVRHVTAIFRKHIDPDFPDINELGRQCSLVMVNSNEMYDIPRPTLHKIVNIGGLGMEKKDAKKLTGDFKKIVERAENVVIFSFGSVANSSAMPMTWKRAFMNAFAQFPDHEFVVRYTEHDMDDYKPPNVHLFKWLPQADLLQHPKVRAMISHGGYNTLQEVINAGKPLITIPLFADQKRNGQLAQKHGFGYNLPKAVFSEENVKRGLEEVLRDPSYTTAVLRMQKMVQKRPFSSEQLLVNWVEFLVEFKELPNLVPYGTKLPFYQLYQLDVIALLTAVTVGLLVLAGLVVRSLYRCCRRCRNSTKVKPE